MKKTKVYKYIGLNGITTSPVYLPDAHPYEFYLLKADEGKVLTNGEVTLLTTIIPISAINSWYEVAAEGEASSL